MSNDSKKVGAPVAEVEAVETETASFVGDIAQYVTTHSRIQRALSLIVSGGTVLGHCVNPIRYDEEGEKEDEDRDDEEDEDDEDEGPYVALLAQLNGLRETAVFCMGGEIVLSPYDCEVRLMARAKGSEWKHKKHETVGPLVALPVDDLLDKYARPSPFGDLRNERTVVDESVRVAAEVAEFSFAFGNDDDDDNDNDANKRQKTSSGAAAGSPPRPQRLLFLDTIRAHLEREFGYRVRLRAHKVNVYSEGGFFKSHVDTPTDPARMIATLVVCLPSAHTGGQLTVEHWGQQYTYDFAGASPLQDGRVQWAAFFADCRHEVLPVLSGRRVTLTFDVITLDDDGEGEQGGAYSAVCAIDGCDGCDGCVTEPSGYDGQAFVSERLFDQGRDADAERQRRLAAVADEVALLAQPSLGIFLTHRYTFGGVDQSLLKGVDRALYEALRARFQCALISVVDYHLLSYDCNYPEYNTTNKSVYAFTRGDVEALSGVSRRRAVPDHAAALPCAPGQIPFVRRWQSKGTALKNYHQGYIEHTGNESQPGEIENVYFHLALIVSATDTAAAAAAIAAT